MVTVAATNIIYTPANFPTTTHFIDFPVQVPTVKASDAWAGQHIGIQLLSSIIDPTLSGGYWDVDNVRLSAVTVPTLLSPAWTNGQFTFTLQSDPGLQFEMLATTNVALPRTNWTSLGKLTNNTGAMLFSDPTTNLTQRLYQAHQMP
jgi:hypothetical protein